MAMEFVETYHLLSISLTLQLGFQTTLMEQNTTAACARQKAFYKSAAEAIPIPVKNTLTMASHACHCPRRGDAICWANYQPILDGETISSHCRVMAITEMNTCTHPVVILTKMKIDMPFVAESQVSLK